MKKKVLVLILTLAVAISGLSAMSLTALAQDSLIPDQNLAAIIKDELGVETITEDSLKELTKLDTLSNDPLKKIKSLEGLQYATNLKDLNIDYSYVTDLTPIKDLTQLEYLNISYNDKITDISMLGGLVNLVEFKAHGNDLIEDFTVISNFTKLTFLNLSICRIDDISFVEGLTQLTNAYFSFNQDIEDISALKNLTKLTNLSLDNNKIVDISVLSGMTDLKILSLNNNLIADFAPILDLSELTSLNVSCNFLSDKQANEILEAFPDLSVNLYPVISGSIEDFTATVPTNMKKGENATIVITVNSGDEVISRNFVSDNPKVLTVDKTGKLTAIDNGKAKITVTVNNLVKSYDVTVGDISSATDDEENFPGWAIALIVVGSVLVAGGIAVAVVFVIKKKKVAAK